MPKGKSKIRWTWHDKTPFPWDRVIKAGVRPGPRRASAEDHLSEAARIAESMRDKGLVDEDTPLTAAQRVAQDLKMRGEALDEGRYSHRLDKVIRRARRMHERLGKALSDLDDQ